MSSSAPLRRLTGLTFVVIALAADAHLVRLSGLRTFVTPIVMHFGSALWIAALMCVPGQTDISLSSASWPVERFWWPMATTTYRMFQAGTLPAALETGSGTRRCLAVQLGMLAAGVWALCSRPRRCI